MRHFWPQFNDWLDRIPDTRFAPLVDYHKRFLLWWGISLYLFQLGSRRQLDFQLDHRGTHVLDNLNRLANTHQTTRPVHDTLHHFLGHSQPEAVGNLRTSMVRRLIRMKALDDARLQGHFVAVLDGTGHITLRTRHCPYCLKFEHAKHTIYQHQVLEAKLLGPADLTLSIGTEFINNSDASGDASGDAKTRKQDCELRALDRLLPELRRDYPQTPLCLAGDALYACGRTLDLAQRYRFAYVLTFKEGQMPAVWGEFQALLTLVPENVREHVRPDGVRQVYRWVHDLGYTDAQDRTWRFHALQCQETVNGQTTTFAWITNLEVTAATVVSIAKKAGRPRWRIENQGFNRQKNSGFHLEHAFCKDPELLKAYYYLLQIGHLITQVFEAGSLLRHLTQAYGQTPWRFLGSLKNLAQRLLEDFRNRLIGDAAYTSTQRIQIRLLQIRLDSS